jgi:hypothetical protein|tara:strand:- start:645 stop:989 length:345 start_codon:yes stop_codon:yes gene_type:complete
MAYINTARRKQRFVFTNDRELYDDILTRKRVQAIRQYSTLNLTPFRANLDNKIQEINHIWKTGDRYFKLASQYYGRPELWWIIAFYNQKPTEGHVMKGDLIKVPTPIELVLYYI